jgi:hypothetical protein
LTLQAARRYIRGRTMTRKSGYRFSEMVMV